MLIKHYIKRQLAGKLIELFKHFPVVVITGARQVGKSTLVKNTFPDIPIVVFDPVNDIENARSDPDLFIKNRTPPVILDEIQYIPQIVSSIKRAVDKDKKAGQYLITGSQQWEVMKLLAESLAGRVVFLDLDNFSLTEIAETENGWIKKWLETESISNAKRVNLPFGLYEQLWRGFMPDAQFLPLNLIADYYSSYQRTYIERDVKLMAEISDISLFGRFFRLCSALTAQEINFSELGREIGVTPQTATRWLNILTATFQWIELPVYAGNTIKRISGKRKGYISDTGITCFSQAISAPEALASHPLWGHIFEAAVVNDIRKQCRLLSTLPNLYHWRAYGGAEVDLILEWNGKFYPIEIKGKSHPSKMDARGIDYFRKTYPNLKIANGLIIAPAETAYQLTNDAYVLPWDVIF